MANVRSKQFKYVIFTIKACIKPLAGLIYNDPEVLFVSKDLLEFILSLLWNVNDSLNTI